MVNQQQSFVAKIDLLNKIDGKYLKIDATEEWHVIYLLKNCRIQ